MRLLSIGLVGLTLAFASSHPAAASAEGAGSGQPSKQSGPDPLLGRSINDRFKVTGLIARGGMGVVYRARQTGLNRTVAIKMILSGHLASDEDVRRFKTEAEAAGNLQHPGIVAVHEVGVHEGRHYFSMDYIEGENFKQTIVANPGELRRLLPILSKVCEGVGYAHRKGIIHRDLKPQNVMIDAAGTPHVMDFGLAQPVGAGNPDGDPAGGVDRRIGDVRRRRGDPAHLRACLGDSW